MTDKSNKYLGHVSDTIGRAYRQQIIDSNLQELINVSESNGRVLYSHINDYEDVIPDNLRGLYEVGKLVDTIRGGKSAYTGRRIALDEIRDAIIADPIAQLLSKVPDIKSDQTIKIIDRIFRDEGYLPLSNAEKLQIVKTAHDSFEIGFGGFKEDFDPDGCFVGGTMVSMWPLDIIPDASGRYHQDEVRAKIWEKPIRDIKVEDRVVSYDKDGLLIPGRVKRTMVNHSKHILDVFGLMVTPGHVTLCGDGKFAGQHVPILDILRSDGAIVKTDGSKVRAATNFAVGSPEDQMIWAAIGERADHGVATPISHGQIRLGTRVIARDEHGKLKHDCVADIVRGMGFEVTDEGLLRHKAGDQTPVPFHWVWSMSLPNPEDYVLSRTDLTLEDIYRANEWEAVKPKMPTPSSIKGNTPASQHTTHSGKAANFAGMATPQVPMSMGSRGTEHDSATGMHKASSQPTLSRQQRRAQERKMRKAAKARKVLATAGH